MHIWTSLLMMGFAGRSPVKCLLDICYPCCVPFLPVFFFFVFCFHPSLVSMLDCRDCDKCQKGVLNTLFLITRGSCFTTISDNSELRRKKKFTRHRKLIHTARAKLDHFVIKKEQQYCSLLNWGKKHDVNLWRTIWDKALRRKKLWKHHCIKKWLGHVKSPRQILFKPPRTVHPKRMYFCLLQSLVTVKWQKNGREGTYTRCLS